jgi:hypothetical protein
LIILLVTDIAVFAKVVRISLVNATEIRMTIDSEITPPVIVLYYYYFSNLSMLLLLKKSQVERSFPIGFRIII